MFTSPSSLDLPTGPRQIFEKSTFFLRNPRAQLPTPAQVRAECKAQGGNYGSARPLPVRFPHLGLIVKFGFVVSITEGQCLLWLKQLGVVRVPEVYGWTTDRVGYNLEVFLYLELIPAVSLKDRWRWLSRSNKEHIARELRVIMDKVHSIPPEPGEVYIGSIGKQPVQEDIFASYTEAKPGPFTSLSSFHEYLLCYFRQPPQWVDPDRHLLPDDVPIQFTHSDLHMGNILVSPPLPWSKESLWMAWQEWSRNRWSLIWVWRALWWGTWRRMECGEPRVVAILDWQQSGWLPSYWEYCKAMWTADFQPRSWGNKYLPMILDKNDVFCVWGDIAAAAGI
ncbi:hypothetical protein DACRYDRAFT_81228 [Dacryopinax primogenitus]|uniref:Aminoglycoside phosphotransferase domain-containing protein n=1 Tax=Dacryopinax primogenitus (strain DJM 731) TaxID=1858805 RepID=M5G376_DACPD|nr:uncharacterized protein DACRYDRAFT_81228 [Dacryopinax primogenitus]EJU00327.1 hypothetical protein DACRYDRAFT_81228 [Dacryopinax primogenitus]